jgi:predicted outer membrane repeat protein
VADAATLVSDLSRPAPVLILDPNQDGFTQVANFLAQHQNDPFSAVHLVSHGATGTIQLGNTLLDAATFHSEVATLKEWSVGLTKGADLLVYGCDVAEGTVGETFITHLAQVTKTDVAASDNLTGSAAQGGDWVLEDHVGSIETGMIFLPAITENYSGILTILHTFTVNKATDTNPTGGGGVGSGTSGDLRWCVAQANAESATLNSGGQYDSIIFSLPVGSTIYLTSTIPISSRLQINGDLNGDLRADITIDGSGSTGAALDLTANNGILYSPTIQNFHNTTYNSGNGGALVISGGYLNASYCTFENNTASGNGGAIYMTSGSTNVDHSLWYENSATNGGAIYATAGNLTLSNDTLVDNATAARTVEELHRLEARLVGAEGGGGRGGGGAVCAESASGSG